MSTTGTNSSLSTIPTAQLGGVRKKNGHKESCKCPICMNMKHDKKKGGYTDDVMEEEQIDYMGDEEETSTPMTAGKRRRRRGNGHKSTCKCPICKNMRKSNKKGGDIEDQIGDVEEEETVEEVEETTPIEQDEEYDNLDAAEKGEAGLNVVGGKRRHKKRGTHKKRKSARKSRKMRKTRKNRRSRRH